MTLDWRYSSDSWGREVFVCAQCNKRLDPREFKSHTCVNGEPWVSVVSATQDVPTKETR